VGCRAEDSATRAAVVVLRESGMEAAGVVASEGVADHKPSAGSGRMTVIDRLPRDPHLLDERGAFARRALGFSGSLTTADQRGWLLAEEGGLGKEPADIEASWGGWAIHSESHWSNAAWRMSRRRKASSGEHISSSRGKVATARDKRARARFL